MNATGLRTGAPASADDDAEATSGAWPSATSAVAVFALLVGVSMTYLPSEFHSPVFRDIYQHVRLLGWVFLCGGLLAAISALQGRAPRGVDLAGRVLLVAALSFYWWSVVLPRGSLATVLYPLMMLAVAAERAPSLRGRGLLPWMVGPTGVAFGALMLFAAPLPARFDLLRPVMLPLSLAFLLGGAGLLLAHARGRARERKIFFAVLVVPFASLSWALGRAGAWSGMHAYLVLASACALAAVGPRVSLRRSVRWKLVRAMGLAALPPMVVLGALVTMVAERSIARELWARSAAAVELEARWIGASRSLDAAAGAPSSSARVVNRRDLSLARAFEGRAVGQPAGLPISAGSALRAGGAAVVEDLDERGRRVLVAYAPVPSAPWTVVSVQDLGASFAPVRQMSAAVMALLAVAAAFAVLLAHQAAREVTGRLDALRRAVADLAGGDLRRRVGPVGEDELGELGEAFDEMAERMEADQRALARMTEALETQLDESRRLQREAEEASRLKDEFLGIVSHELRTPLNALLGWGRMLRRGMVRKEVMPRAFEAIERNALLQARLVEDLLDASRIITGKLRLYLEKVELARVVEGAVDAVRAAALAKGLHLSVDVDRSVEVRGDAARLQQVAQNLLGNAVKFTTEGRVEVRLARRGGEAELVVSDTGEGIAAGFLPHVFDQFRQADGGTTRAHGGLGLGLSIVRHLVEAHGGTVRAESDGPGRGARFVVQLPLLALAEQHAEGGALAPVSEPQVEPTSLTGVKIVLVDDEPDAREVLVQALVAAGADVRGAASTRDALEVLGRFEPHVVISDIGMPGEDGYALAEQLGKIERRLGRPLPAIALTAFARAEDRERALSSGYSLHVTKPVEPDHLAAAVARLLRESLKARGAAPRPEEPDPMPANLS